MRENYTDPRVFLRASAGGRPQSDEVDDLGERRGDCFDEPRGDVTLVDVQIPFWRMVTLFVKTGVALIPAVILLVLIYNLMFFLAMLAGVGLTGFWKPSGL